VDVNALWNWVAKRLMGDIEARIWERYGGKISGRKTGSEEEVSRVFGL
jgi:hypothetical protein